MGLLVVLRCLKRKTSAAASNRRHALPVKMTAPMHAIHAVARADGALRSSDQYRRTSSLFAATAARVLVSHPQEDRRRQVLDAARGSSEVRCTASPHSWPHDKIWSLDRTDGALDGAENPSEAQASFARGQSSETASPPDEIDALSGLHVRRWPASKRKRFIADFRVCAESNGGVWHFPVPPGRSQKVGPFVAAGDVPDLDPQQGIEVRYRLESRARRAVFGGMAARFQAVPDPSAPTCSTPAQDRHSHVDAPQIGDEPKKRGTAVPPLVVMPGSPVSDRARRFPSCGRPASRARSACAPRGPWRPS